MGYGTVSVASNTNILIVPANPQRHSLIITSLGSGVVYLGDNSSVSTATGVAVGSGGNLTEDSSGTKLYMGDFYGISETATTVRYWERVR